VDPRASGAELASAEVAPTWLVAGVCNHKNSLHKARSYIELSKHPSDDRPSL
jgi:hypothetical protein